jgi:hypothetical protein
VPPHFTTPTLPFRLPLTLHYAETTVNIDAAVLLSRCLSFTPDGVYYAHIPRRLFISFRRNDDERESLLFSSAMTRFIFGAALPRCRRQSPSADAAMRRAARYAP